MCHYGLLFVVLSVCIGTSLVSAACVSCNETNGDCQGDMCFCKAGKYGENCTEDCGACTSPKACNESANCIDCSPICSGNGTCRAYGAGMVGCYCDAGYTGDDCSTDVDECTPTNPCYPGTCTNTVGNYTCNCTGTGYDGPTCNEDINECTTNDPCVNGTCGNTMGSYNCTCDATFGGMNCDIAAACETDAECKNGGTCDMYKQCQCKDGYQGDKCENGATLPTVSIMSLSLALVFQYIYNTY